MEQRSTSAHNDILPNENYQKDSVGIYPWFVIAVLIFALSIAFIDRQIISLLVEPMKADLQISDTQMSLLQGLAFALFYTLLGVPIGRLADRKNRRNIIALGIAAWSIFTALCGVAKSYWALFSYRVGVGVGEASLSPAGFSLITDYFPKDRVATAISIYQTGVTIGFGIAMLFGGLVINFTETIQEVNLPLIGVISSWRLTFIIVSLPGILAIIAMLFVREPQRKPSLAGEKEHFTVGEVVSFLIKRKRLFFAHFMGFSLMCTAGYGLAAWTPTYFIRSFDWTAGDAGIYLGLIALFLGTSAVIIGGVIVDKLFRAGYRDAPLRVGIFSAVGMAVSGAAIAFCTNSLMAQIVMVPLMICSFSFLGFAPSALQLVLPNKLRAQVSAMYLFLVNLLGLGLGPTVIALLTDYIFGDEALLKYSLATAIVVFNLIAAAILLSGLQAYRSEHRLVNPDPSLT